VQTPPRARHARRPAGAGWRRTAKILAIALTVAVVAAVGVGGFYAWYLSKTLSDNAVPLADKPTQGPSLSSYDGPFTVLVTGTDECDDEVREAFGARCSGPDADGRLNDVNMLVHVSDAPRRVTVVSFPRDLQIPIPECTNEDGTVTPAADRAPINSAYGRGGLPCVAETISELSGQAIPFAAKVSFGNVVNITDAIGGVEVCIAGDGIDDPDAGIDWEPGPRVVQGYDALAFLRTRKGIGDGSDLARIGNQQQYLSRLLSKLRSDEVLSNPGTLLSLANTAVTNITPSESLADPLRIAQLAYTIRDVPLDDIAFVQYPVYDDPSNTNHVLSDDEGAAILWDALDRNVPFEITGDAGTNGGVEADPSVPAPEASTPPATDEPVPDATTPAPGETAAPEVVELPTNITGSTAAQPTCSVGRG